MDARGGSRPGVRIVPKDEGSLQSDSGRVTTLTFDHGATEHGGSRHSTTHKRTAITAATALVTVNMWTGAPLIALRIGAHVADHRTLSTAAVGVVIAVLAGLVFAMAVALTWLNNAYDELTRRPRAEHRATWLRSMRAEAKVDISQRVGVASLEQIVMINVYIAVISLVIWWAFFAGAPSPILAPRV